MPARKPLIDVGLAEEIRQKYFVPTKPERTETWRQRLRTLVGKDGEALWNGVLDIAAGKAWVPTLPDGREGPPQVPTTNDRLAAYQYVGNMLFGRPVDQTAIVEAERKAAENADLKLLSDEDLLELARNALKEKLVASVPGNARALDEDEKEKVP